jgi:hypothetical protein
MGLIIDPATFGGFDEHLKYHRYRSRPPSPMGLPGENNRASLAIAPLCTIVEQPCCNRLHPLLADTEGRDDQLLDESSIGTVAGWPALAES